MVTLIYCCGSVNYIIALDNCLTVSSTIGLTHILRLSNAILNKNTCFKLKINVYKCGIKNTRNNSMLKYRIIHKLGIYIQ